MYGSKSPFESNLILQMKIYLLHCFASGWRKVSVKMYLSLNHTRDSLKDADSSSNETILSE